MLRIQIGPKKMENKAANDPWRSVNRKLFSLRFRSLKGGPRRFKSIRWKIDPNALQSGCRFIFRWIWLRETSPFPILTNHPSVLVVVGNV